MGREHTYDCRGSNVLDMFGVPPGTEAVYCAMLDHPLADVSELARLLTLPEDVVVQELDQLAGLRLVESRRGSPTSLTAVPPELAIEALIAREEERIAAAQQQMRQARDSVGGLVHSFVGSRCQRDDAGMVELIDDARVVTSRLFQLTRGAEERVSFVLPGDPLPQSALGPSARLDDELLARRVPLRIIVTESSLAAPHWHEHLCTQVAKGAQVRAHPAPPTRLVVVDGRVAVLPRHGSSGAVLVHGPDLVGPLGALFDEVWHVALPLTPTADGAAEPLVTEARIRQVVTLLAQGHKDETIARRLGVSVRTVRRLVSAAVTSLHAESRFQAGVLAARRGWLD